ncbi:uncharacterized protein BDZ99DRAFT_273768 [Mytilinidion resinicola]|uniref:Uncharacterized protein n=1 Tax=Mytilinidion resinicola TaxID=574789 RepID=A0A6A6YRC3_9PEZI|nr:uncharacterized protein BDZ99DRAFT_273768 [Mytilinidion resinicola]KAF2811321.1 hypothetical protein BDZ99DRAFT_273768 [Mytilinidion resinicola]
MVLNLRRCVTSGHDINLLATPSHKVAACSMTTLRSNTIVGRVEKSCLIRTNPFSDF